MNLEEKTTFELVSLVRREAESWQKPDNAVWRELMARFCWVGCPKEDLDLISGLDALLMPLNGGYTMMPPRARMVPGAAIPPPPPYYQNRIQLSQVTGSGQAMSTQQTDKNMSDSKPKAIKAFISYSHKDADLLNKLHEHLSALRRQGLLDDWTDKEIRAGGVIDDHIDRQIKHAQLYLLLVSSAFIQSNYCFDIEFKRACERQQAGEAVIVPIIIRECDWNIPELKRFKALPDDGKPVVSRHWHDEDAGFASVSAGLRKLLETWSGGQIGIKKKSSKEKFVPTDSHITVEQREELRKLADEIVDRLVARMSGKSDAEIRKVKGKHYQKVWGQFNERFNTKEHGLQSLARESFDDAKSWLRQYRGSKDKNFKRVNPQKYRNTLTKTIYTLAGKLGWPDEQLYSFAAEKVGCQTISGLSDLGNSQLELVRDRIRYEQTKSQVKSAQGKARQRS